jgi:predicted ATP-dependent serine protease
VLPCCFAPCHGRIDLPVRLALAGSRSGQTLPAHLTAFSEIDFKGEVRAVPTADERFAA